MLTSSVDPIEVMILLLLIFVVGFGIIANSLKIAYPIILVIGGLIVSLIPGMPRYTLTPEIVFVVFLPPLIFSGAFNTSWRELKVNFEPIFLLAVGLVGVTAIGIAFFATMILHGFDWRLGLILGAVVAPTDTIAVLSIAKRFGLHQRILDIIEGESLLNDASGLITLEFAISIVITGITPTLSESIVQFIYLISVGIVTGLIIGKVTHFIETSVNHAPIEIIISVLAPYLAYLSANQLQASGIMAVVTCGLYLGRYSSIFYSSKTRLSAAAVWDSMTYILNGIVFLLIGLQLPMIYQEIGGKERTDWSDLLFHGLVLSIVIVLIRIIWIYIGANTSYTIRRVMFGNQSARIPNSKTIFVAGWAGMRGVISLAAALAIPLSLNNGYKFPQREMIIYLAFCVILFSLVVQGLTIPFFIRRFKVTETTELGYEETQAREIMINSALEYLKIEREKDDPQFCDLYDDLSHIYEAKTMFLDSKDSEVNQQSVIFRNKYHSIRKKLGFIEREKVIELRNQNMISDRILKKLEREIDLTEEYFRYS